MISGNRKTATAISVVVGVGAAVSAVVDVAFVLFCGCCRCRYC